MAKIQIINGNFQDFLGNPIANGKLVLELNNDEASVNTAQIGMGRTVTIPLDTNGNVSGTVSVWPNDQLLPANSYYTASVYSSRGELVWGPNSQRILSSSPPFDLNAWIPNETYIDDGSLIPPPSPPPTPPPPPPPTPPPAPGTPFAALVAPNTSAYTAYNKFNFPSNFTGTTWITQSGTTMSVDSNKMDDSLNPVTPIRVSSVDVHTLYPAAPTIPWYVHSTPWFGSNSHIQIGVNCNTTIWVQNAIEDMVRRGFNGVIVDWYGKGSFTDNVLLKIQSYLNARPGNTFKFGVCFDNGVPNLSQSTLVTQIGYIATQYFSDPNYIQVNGQPMLHFFGVASTVGDTVMSTVKSVTPSAFWMEEDNGPTGYVLKSYFDGTYNWTHNWHNTLDTSDPFDLTSTLESSSPSVMKFYNSVAARPTKKFFASVCPGFNGYLTKSVGWSKGKYLPRTYPGFGSCWASRAAFANSHHSSSIVAVIVPTWNDYEEGSQIETGIQNDITVTPSISTNFVNWSVSGGTGDESMISYYQVYASADNGATANLISNPVNVGVGTFDLSTAGLVSGITYKIYVEAVGLPCVSNHMSTGVSYTA